MNTDKIYAESIAKEYAPQKASKAVALKKLDAKAKRPSLIFAYVFGIACTLILGVGMCLCMGQIGYGDTTSIICGVLLGIFGIVGVSINYPIFKVLRTKGKKKYAFEIMQLAKEISGEE